MVINNYLTKLFICTIILLSTVYVLSDRFFAFQPLLVQIQSSPLDSKRDLIRRILKFDYGLVNYSLTTHCKGSIACFVKFIPEPVKSRYTSIGDLLYGMEGGIHGWRIIEKRMLADDQFQHKFAVKYMRSMGWIKTSTPSYWYSQRSERVNPYQLFFRHDWRQAKKVLLEYKNQYRSPQDREIVIYVRAADKLDPREVHTCTRTNQSDGCNTVLSGYADYIAREAAEITKNHPGIEKITIVTARRGFAPRDKELNLFTDIIQKLLPITKNIWLHSSNDLDEDIFYMGTAKHLIAHKDIGNLSYIIREIQAAKIEN